MGRKRIQARGNMASRERSFKVNRRALYAIAALAVAAAVVLAGVAYYLDVYRYPSENTPLVLRSWGISWVMEQGEPNHWYLAAPFENLSLYYTPDFSIGYGTSPLNSTFARASISEFELPSNVTALFETYLIPWHSDDTVNGVRIIGAYGVFITDENENGLFDYGDAISLFYGVYENGTLTHQGFQNNTEYGIGLNPSGDTLHASVDFKYAIHHGKLYAWGSNWPYSG